MKEALVLGIVAFVVAVGGGTYFGAFLSPPRSARSAIVADSVAQGRPAAKALMAKPAEGKSNKADATSPDAAKADSTLKPGAGHDSGRVPSPVAAPIAPGTPANDPRAAKSVGKILVAMKPAQAAKILEKLTDDDIEAIVRQLNAKQVAPLLVALPGERAVAMSRRLLGAATTREGKS